MRFNLNVLQSLQNLLSEEEKTDDKNVYLP